MIRVTRESSAPTDRLWAVMSDVRHWADWLPTVDAVTPVEPDRPDEVGASYPVEQPGLPTAVWTITVDSSMAVVTSPAEPASAPPATAQDGSEASVRQKLVNPSETSTTSRRTAGRRHNDASDVARDMARP